MVHGKLLIIIAFLLLFFSSISCSKEKEKQTPNLDMEIITQDTWLKLTRHNIFFGHQSVGNNILDGIFALKNSANVESFSIKIIDENLELDSSSFLHGNIGQNQDPFSKVDAFSEIVHKLGDSIDIAFMKFCYIDFNKHTQIEQLFNYYDSTLKSLQEEFPNLRLVHCTAPLRIKPIGIKGFVKLILKMDNNIYINKYNNILRSHYPDNTIIDIAQFESTTPENIHNLYGSDLESLYFGYTYDGGHLNDKGKQMVSIQVLVRLGQIIENEN